MTNDAGRVEVVALDGIPEVELGTDLGELIGEALERRPDLLLGQRVRRPRERVALVFEALEQKRCARFQQAPDPARVGGPIGGRDRDHRRAIPDAAERRRKIDLEEVAALDRETRGAPQVGDALRLDAALREELPRGLLHELHAVDLESLRREPGEIDRLPAERHEDPRARRKIRARVPFERGADRGAVERRRTLGPALFPESLVQRTSAPLLFPEGASHHAAHRPSHDASAAMALSYASSVVQSALA